MSMESSTRSVCACAQSRHAKSGRLALFVPWDQFVTGRFWPSFSSPRTRAWRASHFSQGTSFLFRDTCFRSARAAETRGSSGASMNASSDADAARRILANFSSQASKTPGPQRSWATARR